MKGDIMLTRTVTGAIVAALIYLWLFFSHVPVVLYGGTVILCILALIEVYQICQTGKPYTVYLSFAVSVVLLLLPIPGYEYVSALVFPIAVLAFLLMMRFMDQIEGLRGEYATAIGIVIVLLFKSVPYLREWDNGFYYLTFAVTACFVTDIAALLFGKAFGSHKLCPKISPKKTVEGAVGGVICTVLAAVFAVCLLERYEILFFERTTLLIWALLVSVAGQFGDLCMSVVKRIAGVKDFGRILPGHGGILDRFDSHMFAVAFTLVFCALGGGFIY